MHAALKRGGSYLLRRVDVESDTLWRKAPGGPPARGLVPVPRGDVVRAAGAIEEAAQLTCSNSPNAPAERWPPGACFTTAQNQRLAPING
jgi:hypothetical protein